MEKEIYGIIYMIRNKINNKIYFGQTIQKRGFRDRYGKNGIITTHNEHLRRSIEKYGIENFEINEEFDIAFSQEELDSLEDLYIKMYDTLHYKHGYNERAVKSHRHSEFTKKKISEQKKGKYTGKNNPFYGKKHSEETKQKIREKHAENPYYTSNEFRKTISKAVRGEKNPMYGKKHSEETKKKISESQKDKNTKKICQYDKQGNLIYIHNSITQAATDLNLHESNIIACLKGRQKTCGGYMWKYFEFVEED